MQGASSSSIESNDQFADDRRPEHGVYANAQHAPDDCVQTHLQNAVQSVQLGGERNLEAEHVPDNVDAQSTALGGGVDDEGVSTLQPAVRVTPETKEYSAEQAGDSNSEQSEPARETVHKERLEDRGKELQV
jgi:hypothetical protein